MDILKFKKLHGEFSFFSKRKGLINNYLGVFPDGINFFIDSQLVESSFKVIFRIHLLLWNSILSSSG